MNFEEFQQAPCVIPPSTVGGQCAGIDPRCLDPEWAANHLETCPGAAAIVGLKVTPAVGEVDVGGAMPFIAALQFSDGGTKDVTDLALWTVSDSDIASIDVYGLANGIAEGTTTVQATYSGLTGFAELDVVAHCVQAGLDIVIVFDRSAGMGNSILSDGTPTPNGESVLELCKKAAHALVGSAVLTSGKDKIAIVSCAGTYREGELSPYTPDSTLHIVLSSVEPDILAAIDSVQMGNCYFDTTPGNHNTECATGIGAGLDRARQELLQHGRANARQLIVYVGAGWEVFCNPSPVTVAADIAARNWQLAGIVVGPAITHYPCDIVGPLSTWDYVRALVTCNLFFGVEDAGDLPTAFAAVLNSVCGKQGDPCLYYVAPVVDPPPVTRYRDQLDYFGWINWTVVKGYVDLIGIDLWPLQPGHGMYVDMVGTDIQHPHRDEKDAVGAIESKQTFNFAPGRYRLTFEVAGNLRTPNANMSLRVTIEGLLDETITVNDWKQPFTPYTYDFSTSTAIAAKLKFEHLRPEDQWCQTIGLLLDDVHLENLDTGAVLLDDTFDQENPLP